MVPCGERWPDGSLRPALEDLLGAGAIVSAVVSHGTRRMSGEAEAAQAAFATVKDIGACLHACASGLELASKGHGDDVSTAGEVGVSRHVSLLMDGAFTAVT